MPKAGHFPVHGGIGPKRAVLGRRLFQRGPVGLKINVPDVGKPPLLAEVLSEALETELLPVSETRLISPKVSSYFFSTSSRVVVYSRFTSRYRPSAIIDTRFPSSASASLRLLNDFLTRLPAGRSNLSVGLAALSDASHDYPSSFWPASISRRRVSSTRLLMLYCLLNLMVSRAALSVTSQANLPGF